MLRHLEQHRGGVKIYTHHLLQHLLSFDSGHEFVLMYKNPRLVGKYNSYANVEEVAMRVPGTITWDQIAVPWITWQYKLDVIFNPKFAVPFLARAKKVFVMHGSEWFVIPDTFLWYDRLYTRFMVPLYCRKSDAILSVTETVAKDVVEFTGVKRSKITPVYNGFEPDIFHVVNDAERLSEVRSRYKLPDRFILWTGQIYPPKNCGRLLEALARVRDQVPHHLVIAGEERWRAKEALKVIEGLDLSDRVNFAGWVSHEDLPVLYNLADLFVLPSLYEGFGIPLIEAMACGCPVLTSKTGSPPEVVDGAAYLVDPHDVGNIAAGITGVLTSEKMRSTMTEKGLRRAKDFGWERCAREVLAVLERVGGDSEVAG